MSHDGSVTFKWADGEYRFLLDIGGIRELQQKCDAGPAELFARFFNHTWRLDDVRETIRIGLIGGGLKPREAIMLVERYVDARPLLESVSPARAIIGVALRGVPDEPLGKTEAASETDQASPSSREESSASRPSTDGDQR